MKQISDTLDLQQITLVSATSVNIEKTVTSLLVSSEYVNFANIKLLSDQAPSVISKNIQQQAIAPLDLQGYNKFMIEKLNDFIDTPFCLVVQPDGFLINPHLWREDFLEYDYIGAPWFEFMKHGRNFEKVFHFNKNQVGNGGFSLRSKKLLSILSKLKFEDLNCPVKNEDFLICHFLYDYLIDLGVRFAPLKVAHLFSIESAVGDMPNELASTFGFHGKFWMVNPHLKKLDDRSAHRQNYLNLLD